MNKIKPKTRMESANIKDFFDAGPVRVISDPEGYHVCQLAHEERSGEPKNKMLVLGDLMDYTLGAGPNGNNFATDKLTELRKAKSNSFKSIKYCLDNKSRVKVLFGNRDLNKLKLLPLGLITDAEGKYDKWWLEPNKTYLELASDLVVKLKNGSNWAIPSMKNWKPFWKFNQDNGKYEMPNGTECKIWAEEPRLVDDKASKISCLERYYLIFGADCMQGTMGGQNNLFGVAMECGDAYNSIFGKHSDFLKSITGDKTNYLLTVANQPGNETFKNDCELAAALVFTVYMDALYGTQDPTEGKPFTGVLHRFFNAANTYFCAYAELGSGTTPNLLTFSHGGMRAEFFTKCDLKDNSKDYFPESDILLKEAFIKQQGGHLGTEDATNLSSSDITKQINKYNISMKATLKKAIEFYQQKLGDPPNPSKIDDKPTAELLINLVISVPYKYGVGCSHIDAGPINPGIVGYRKMPIVARDAKLYQFIGHGPMGFAPTIDKYLSKDGKMASYLINLDISNSLFGQFGVLNTDNINQNYSYVDVSFKNNKLEAKSNVLVSINKYDIEGEGLPIESPDTSAKTTEIKILNHNLLILLSGQKSVEFFKTQNTNYHGTTTINGLNYDLFTTVNDKYVVSLHAFKKIFQGGRSIRRHHKTTSTRLTGKSRAGKFHIRRSHTLVRRKPMMKRTAKKH